MILNIEKTRYKEDDNEQTFFVEEIICHKDFVMSSNTIKDCFKPIKI